MRTAPRRPTRSLALVAALALLATVPACTSSGEDRSDGPAEPAAPTSGGPDEPDQPDQDAGPTDGSSIDGSSIAELLALAPDTPAGREVVMVTRWDVVEGAVDAPADGASEATDPVERERERLARLTGTAPTEGGAAGGLLAAPRQVDHIGALGFLPSDVRAEITVGQPPELLTVVLGELDPVAVLEAAGQVEGSTRASQDDLEVVRWLEDNAFDRELENPVGTLPGGSGRVAVADGLVAHTTADAPLDRFGAARAGRGSTLAEVEPLRRAAEALDEVGAHSAALSATPVRPQPRIDLDPDVRPTDEPTLAPYEAYALGGLLTDEGPQLVVVLVHADDDGADENRRRLATVVEDGGPGDGRRWSEVLEDPRIAQEGPTVVARFDAASPSLWSQIFVRQDPLLAVG